jgi:hypothetical protein
MGGLGNQMFQIFATISLAIQNGHKFYFSNIETIKLPNTVERHTYWNTFFSRLRFFLKEESQEKIAETSKIIKEKGFHYQPILMDGMSNENNIMLLGYFQSYKYFKDNYNTIYKMIGVDNARNELVKKNIFDETFCENTISIHFRFGDYLKLTKIYHILDYKYYKKALKHLTNHMGMYKTMRVLIFCDDQECDNFKELKTKLISDFENVYSLSIAPSNLTDWEEMLLMSCCKYNIIANSTFSWWGAYLNNNADKIVCYPSKWFSNEVKHDMKDFFPEEWIKI